MPLIPRIVLVFVHGNNNNNIIIIITTTKSAKYADLPASYIFQPIALETLGPMNFSAMEFFTVVGRKIGVLGR